MKENIKIRNVCDGDSELLQKLASECPPLDVHTPYTYWVIARFFGKNSFIAEIDGKPLGYITSVENGEETLVWQIGIKKEVRGSGLAYLLIDKVIAPAIAAGRKVYVSIDRSNAPSNGAFSSYCRKNGLILKNLKTVALRSVTDADFYECEDLFLIEPDEKGC